MSNSEILRVENLVKKYGKGANEVTAVNDMSLTITKGEFVAIVGASGSGKSTLLHLLGGVDAPTSGKVFINGEDIYSLKKDNLAIFRRKNIGLIYQFYNLIPILNVTENITLPVELDGTNPDQKKLDELISMLGLEGRLNHLPNELSGGQQQRVSIGRALINNPALILADEPTGNLDSKSGSEVLEALRVCNQTYNQTIVIITHDLNIAANADRVVTIEDGQIVSDTSNYDTAITVPIELPSGAVEPVQTELAQSVATVPDATQAQAEPTIYSE
ncbi:MAG: ABC transporter ATP-binding protein [Bifidobacteriaceae bacterium]|jgi:putative ABC transport system ATP-binding protein|nr:ABC transporter ATP-binding protein [Bifidobacteriaceae bacterium]